MNDLDLITRLRPDVAEPDPVVLSRHRMAILERAADPGPVRAVRPRFRPRLAISGAAVAAAAAVAVMVGISGPGAPPATAATVLSLAADAAAAAAAGHGDWTYTSSVTVSSEDTRPKRVDTWVKTDGSEAEVRDERAAPWRGVIPEVGEPSLYNQSYDYLETLPTDPAALRAEIYRQVQGDLDRLGVQNLYTVDQWAFQMIAHLVDGAAPPDLKAALYRVAATVPGVQLIDDMWDVSGRHGLGVTRTTTNAGDMTTLVFDRDTYQVLGWTTTSHDGRAAGKALLATGLVDEAGQTP
ncbi:CU044_5270 family protein [Amycolatopsis thermalba]|uniref:CU044_5270 family protein n=1 Tax=Amycolatopsis thermalba TaxID=944492 RepID=UPI000E2280AE|nr:CU044_5270 family protein [Amycolatopsis thermalba]